MADSLLIDKLNRNGYDIRLTDPNQTIKLGYRALALATEKNDKNLMAESSRIIGIGFFNLNQNDSSVVKYLNSLSLFQETGNVEGQARVYNNIGNLYRDVDFKSGLTYFRKSLNMAIKAKMTDLIGGIYLNIGIIYHHKKLYKEAITNFDKSFEIFKELGNETGQILCLQSKGVVLYTLEQVPESKRLLTEAIKRAKKNNLNKVVASVNLTLTNIFIKGKEFERAEESIKEGIVFSRLSQSKKIERDYIWLSYELENKRKNYKKAIDYLNIVYSADSADFDNAKSEQIKLLEQQSNFLQKQKENEIIIERQKSNKILLMASIAVSVLAFAVILLLVKNNKKKAKTNKILSILNQEISLQKENLNRVNHNLEDIIHQRTIDLQIKNRKLSEYSAHLSHQIRGPIATMKGLMILEKESLMEDKDFIVEISKCVNEIDDRIININDVLHNLSEPGLIPKPVDKENKS